MSLADLTRNCFQSGMSAVKWLALAKLFISKERGIMETSGDVESNVSNSVLILYRSYPGDPDLKDYLKYAIQDKMVSVPVFIVTLLQAARSPELHSPTTLDTLCRVALDAHYSSGLPPIGSVVSYIEPSMLVLDTIQDALALLRTAHSLPISQHHDLITSASELVILLLSCVSDLSQVSTAQAMVHFADANGLLQHFRLAPDVRHVLETFVLSLSLLIGDDAKAAREAQIMHTIQLELGKGDVLGPSSDTDIVTFSLILHHLITYRAHDFGSGSGSDPVSILVGTFRWTSWTPTIFYTQLLLSAFTCLSQNASTSQVWKAFIIGRLPGIMVSFESALNSDNTLSADWRSAMHFALVSVSRRSDLIALCDHLLSRGGGSSSMSDDDTYEPFFRNFLQHLIILGIIDPHSASEIDPLISSTSTQHLRTEARDAGTDLELYLDSKLMPDIILNDFRTWIDRIWRDVESHSVFADVVLKRFSMLASVFDLESLSHLCKILYTYEAVLDIIAIHVKISGLVTQALSFLDEYDCETVGDPQTAVSHLGDVVLLVQYTVSRFHLQTEMYSLKNEAVCTSFLRSTDTIYPIGDMSGEDAVAFNAWFKALFDSSSEGIEDTILRSTQPKTLLRISATLFSQAIKARLAKKIDVDVLNNGVSYFTGPLLNWTLVGVVKALVMEVHQKGFTASTHLEILQTLLLSPSCPGPVISLCGPYVSALFVDKKGKNIPNAGASVEALRLKMDSSHFPGNKITWQPRQAVQDALAMARTGKAPILDVERCIKAIPPHKFLQLLWSELALCASLGEMENCRRIAIFVLTMPRSSYTPPLLPIFLFNVVPLLISVIDHQQPPEQTVNVELFVTVVSSALTATLHLEWAMRTTTGENRVVLGESSAVMARRFATDLRGRKESYTSSTVTQRLAASQSFITNFPAFMMDN